MSIEFKVKELHVSGEPCLEILSSHLTKWGQLQPTFSNPYVNLNEAITLKQLLEEFIYKHSHKYQPISTKEIELLEDKIKPLEHKKITLADLLEWVKSLTDTVNE